MLTRHYPLYHLSSLVLSILALILLQPFDETSPPSNRSHLVSFLVFSCQLIRLIIFSRSKPSHKSLLTCFQCEMPFVMKFSDGSIAMIFTIISIMFLVILALGGPLLSDFDQSLSLAVIISSLAFLPSLFTKQLLSEIRGELILEYLNKPFYKFSNLWILSLSLTMQFTLIGAWFGAFWLKLDWITPWRIYPIPSVMGALIFHGLACIFSICLASFRNQKCHP
ncbi:phosphatidylinositol glycan anchor biosynthesis class F [Brevipalpus obovatus]|uniref:phosphatidylinositol glycan anchor biosynthesis class F n=1 Tax=Brevipalpus obovatus TaxID=246614 RepID=UPI003D9F25E4